MPELLTAEGFVEKVYDNEAKNKRKWKAIILKDKSRWHYWGNQDVQEGMYVKMEYKQSSERYPRLENLYITDPPTEKEEAKEYAQAQHEYRPFEQAKARMHSAGLVKDLFQSAIQIAPRNEDGTLDEKGYKSLMDFLQKDLLGRANVFHEYALGKRNDERSGNDER